MEFGSFMEFHKRGNAAEAEAFRESFAHVDQAEKMGLDAVWLAESHFNPRRAVLSSPMVIATSIATRTNRLKVGTAVQVLPLTNPLRVAEETATLDHVSEGRFEFGVGRSGSPGSYEGYNISYADSRERFFETLDVIKKAWTQERFSHQGQFYSYDDVCLVPKPYQQPHPPLRMAATTSDTFPMAARLGLPLFIGLRVTNMSQVAEQVKSYKQAWEEAGNEGEIDVSLRAPVYIAETKEEAVSEPEESFMSQFRRLGSSISNYVASAGMPSQEEVNRRTQQLSSITWEEVQREKVAVGTPEMVIERLQEMKETLQLSSLTAEFNAGGLIPQQDIARSLRLFCEKIVPAFK